MIFLPMGGGAAESSSPDVAHSGLIAAESGPTRSLEANLCHEGVNMCELGPACYRSYPTDIMRRCLHRPRGRMMLPTELLGPRASTAGRLRAVLLVLRNSPTLGTGRSERLGRCGVR